MKLKQQAINVQNVEAIILYNEIWEDVESVIRYSQEYYDDMSIDLTELRVKWEQNKKKWLDMWGGPILEMPQPITFNLNQETKEKEVLEFCNWVERKYHAYDLSNFIWGVRQSFFKNKVPSTCGWDDCPKEIKAGMKITKAFKYFIDDKDKLEEIRTEASRIIQKDKVNGTLVFSVHPLDYLSISETTYNWRSCHAMDGDYRLGNLNYMTDACTVVCYIKDSSGSKYNLPNFPDSVPWNSKKWRVLLYMSGSATIASRQYPFAVQDVFSIIDHELSQPWNTTGFTLGAGPWVTDTISDMQTQTVNAPHTGQFNDTLTSSSYLNIWHKGWANKPIVVGEPIHCLHCGKEYPAGADTFLCFSCECNYGTQAREDIFVCDCCGYRKPISELYQTQDGSYICEQCVQEETVVCATCGEIIFYDLARYSLGRDSYYCADCWTWIDDSEDED